MKQRVLRIVTGLAVLAAPMLIVDQRPAVAAAAAPRLTTPELITRAEHAGRIGRHTAFELRLRALRGAKLPAAYRSGFPFRGTEMLLRMRDYLEHGGRARVMGRGPLHPLFKLAEPVLGLLGLQPGVFDCVAPESPQLQGYDTAHFHFQYAKRRHGGGLFIRDYANAFEKAWQAEVDRLGWAPPPPPKNGDFGGRYLVVIDQAFQPLLYGLAAPIDTVGDNPATPWNDVDAQSSCIVINGRFDPVQFPGGAQVALDATAAHEFFHAIQYGMGTLDADPANIVLAEGSATWMEDEVFDYANDSYNYLWPDLTENMATHTSSVYGYFVVFRSFAERLGGDGHRFMHDVFDLISQRRARDVHAITAALGSRGLWLGQAFHDLGVALAVLRPCGGAYVQPYCFEEAAGYRESAGPARVEAVLSRGETYDSTIEDDMAMHRFALPGSGADYTVTITNRSRGGLLRASAVCDTGNGLRITTLPNRLGAGASGALALNVGGCSFVRLVVTNEAISKGYPEEVPARRFTVKVG